MSRLFTVSLVLVLLLLSLLCSITFDFWRRTIYSFRFTEKVDGVWWFLFFFCPRFAKLSPCKNLWKWRFAKICRLEICQRTVSKNYTTRKFISLYSSMENLPFKIRLLPVLEQFFSWFFPSGLLEVGRSVEKKSVWLPSYISYNWYW